MKIIKILTINLLAATVLAGCVGQTELKRDPNFAPVTVNKMPAAPQGNGAIFQSGYENTWFEDIKARRIGDILIVSLVESTEAKHSNAGSAKRSNTTSITNPTLFGKTPSFAVPTKPADFNLTLDQSLSSSTDFSGSADNTQNNALTGSVTVTVTEVMPNGNLKVRGEKRLGMAGGNEYIRVSGIVRPTDIDATNTVASTSVADASLIYVGDGQHAQATEMGFLAKFFISALMPF